MDVVVELGERGLRVVKVTLPDAVPDGVAFPLRLDGQDWTAVWYRAQAVLALRAASGVERLLRVRARTVSHDGDGDGVRVEAEIVYGGVHRARAAVRPDVPGQVGRGRASAGREQVVRSQITGRVLRVLVVVGERVESGQALVLVEAMKMENRVFSQAAGTVQRLAVADGDAVQTGKELMRIAP